MELETGFYHEFFKRVDAKAAISSEKVVVELIDKPDLSVIGDFDNEVKTSMSLE